MNSKFFTCLRHVHLGMLTLSLGAMVLAISLVGCNKSGASSSIEGVPFQTEEGGSWGMLQLDQPDKPLFSEEFDREPSSVYDGCFSVQDKDGLYRIYSAESKPKQIGERYAQVGVFSDGIAPVAKPGDHISLIDKSGKTVKVLDRVEGKRILSCNSFVDGRARYQSEDGKFGYLDKHGKAVIPAKYEQATDFAGGRAFVIDTKYKKYMQTYDDDSWKHVQISLIDTDGKVQATFRASDALTWFGLIGLQKQTYFGFTSGEYIAWNNGEKHGIYDNKGKVILNPEKSYVSIEQITSDGFVYRGTGGQLGYSTLKGEKVIREKYFELRSLTPDRFVARKKENGDWYIIDREDNRLATYDDLEVLPRGNLLLAKDGDSKILVDYDGKRVGKMEVHDLGKREVPWMVEDGYAPAELVAEALQMTPNGLLGLTFKSTTATAAKALGYTTPQHVKDAGYTRYFMEKRKNILDDSYSVRIAFKEDILQGEWEKVTYNGFFLGDWKLKNLSFVSSPMRAMSFSVSWGDRRNQDLYEAFQKYLSRWSAKEVTSEGSIYIAQNGPIYYLLVRGSSGVTFVYAHKDLLNGSIQQLASSVQLDLGGAPSVQVLDSDDVIDSATIVNDLVVVADSAGFYEDRPRY